jgi:hypothetical protein
MEYLLLHCPEGPSFIFELDGTAAAFEMPCPYDFDIAVLSRAFGSVRRKASTHPAMSATPIAPTVAGQPK